MLDVRFSSIFKKDSQSAATKWNCYTLPLIRCVFPPLFRKRIKTTS